MKVIVKAKEIPIGSEVRKIGGEKLYELVNQIKIYQIEGKPNQEIKADNNAFFLVPKDRSFSISVVSGETELVWDVDPQDLYTWIEDNYMLN